MFSRQAIVSNELSLISRGRCALPAKAFGVQDSRGGRQMLSNSRVKRGARASRTQRTASRQTLGGEECSQRDIANGDRHRTLLARSNHLVEAFDIQGRSFKLVIGRGFWMDNEQKGASGHPHTKPRVRGSLDCATDDGRVGLETGSPGASCGCLRPEFAGESSAETQFV